LPKVAVTTRITPRSFFSRQVVKYVARSIVRWRVRIPTAWKYPWMASPMEL